MTRIVRSIASTAAIGLLWVIMPLNSCAQPADILRTGAYIGASGGGYLEAWEGESGGTGFGSVMVGYDFSARWGLRGEFGRTGDVCDGRRCHVDVLPYLTLIRRFSTGPRRAYVMFGFVPHVGIGVEHSFGGRFALLTEVDIQSMIYNIALRPKAVLQVRF